MCGRATCSCCSPSSACRSPRGFCSIPRRARGWTTSASPRRRWRPSISDSERTSPMRALRHDYPLLLRIQLLELRTWGPLVAVLTTLLPIAMILGCGVIGGGVERDGYLYIVSGSAVISLVTIGLVATAQDLGEMQRDGVFQYYASLPISKAALLGALTT